MPYNKYLPMTLERYEIMRERYTRFLEVVHDETKEPVNVFDPLGPQQMRELMIIREVSKELQKKKDEDLKKAEEAATEAEAKAKEVAAQEAEVPTETTPVEA